MNKLDDFQQEAFDRIKKNFDKNFFIQGQAGTGKSTLINYLRENLERTVAVVAPTGIAAQLIGGSTIHRMFHLGAPDYFRANDVKNYKEYEYVLKKVHTLIVDEVSMLRADVFDTMNHLCKRAKDCNEVFGGIQVILVGDLHQLPPVYKHQDDLFNYMLETYQVSKPFFFDAKCYNEGNFEKLELQKVHRQNADEEFLSCLQTISIGNTPNNMGRLRAAIEALNSRVEPGSTSGDWPVVTARRKQAETINHDKLAALPGEERRYKGTLSGDYSESDALAPLELHLKVGAKVMFCRNDTQEQKYVNGTMGVVLDMSDDSIAVQTEKGDVVDVCQTTWQKQEYVPSSRETDALELKTCGSYVQFPLKLAYAITIHKSQGQTWNNVCIDLGNGGAFAEGQTYVALSRVKTMSGVHLAQPLSCEDAKTNLRVQQFLETGTRPQPVVPRRRDWESMKSFWSGIILRFTAAKANMHCCSHPMTIRRLDNSYRFQIPCYWFLCKTQELEQPLFLICVDGNSSTLFEIPAHTFTPGKFRLERDIRANDSRYNDLGFRRTSFDLFLETAGHYMELRTGINFDSYMIASETDWNVHNLRENEDEE